MAKPEISKDQIKQSIIGKLQRYYGKTLGEATPYQVYFAVASTLRDQIMKRWVDSKEEDRLEGGKRVYYLSIEFLLGRALFNNALNLLATEPYTKALTELGLIWRDIIEEEPEPGLGNGGLGRLAACFMDSLATLDLPAMGSTIRYEYGLFRQKLQGGKQIELPDDWLQNGNIWEVASTEDVVEVHFEGQVASITREGRQAYTLTDYRTVEAVPYDMPAVGYGNQRINTLRTWRARSKQSLDLSAFSNGDYLNATKEKDLADVISKVLYPEDNHYEGKTLRLCQHYFLVSATLQYALKDFEARFGKDYRLLPDKAVFHINDTHPGLAIVELMRLLMDEKGLGWEEAQAITNRCMAYTNHTVLSEALERWPEDLVRRQLPRIYMILEEMNRRLCEKLWDRFPGEWDRIAHMAILAYGMVHMANLCVSQSFSVNGVSELHGEILKADTFRDYAILEPRKFTAITNGVTHRRWLMACNPRLSALITEAIGDQWIREPEALKDLLPFRDDAAFLDSFANIKRHNKEVFSEFLLKRQEMAVEPDFFFDVHVKRLHEYKRQMLNALHIHVLYNRIMDDPTFDIPPRIFIFGAKASRGYDNAKLIIRYILALSRLIDRSPRAKKMLRVLFVENWNVSAAEALIPAADLSEQISTAGKEASGTGNMKLMMNGALTIGTLDGANVEISQAVGRENIYLFGMKADQVAAMYKEGTYAPIHYFEQNVEIRKALTQMIDGTLFPDNPAILQQLYHDLLFGSGGSRPDNYYVLKDFGSYDSAHQRISRDYLDQAGWLRKAVTNTAMSGFFSTDRTIKEYNEKIWKLK
jgi:starch phosphorylase